MVCADSWKQTSIVWTHTLSLPAGDYYVVLRGTSGAGWTTDGDDAVGNVPRLVVYSDDCNAYVGRYTFGETTTAPVATRGLCLYCMYCMLLVVCLAVGV
jgi:hypothetical protein